LLHIKEVTYCIVLFLEYLLSLHIARVSSYTAASNIMYSSWATLANKMISL